MTKKWAYLFDNNCKLSNPHRSDSCCGGGVLTVRHIPPQVWPQSWWPYSSGRLPATGWRWTGSRWGACLFEASEPAWEERGGDYKKKQKNNSISLVWKSHKNMVSDRAPGGKLLPFFPRFKHSIRDLKILERALWWRSGQRMGYMTACQPAVNYSRRSLSEQRNKTLKFKTEETHSGVILQLQFHSNNLDKSDLDGAKSRK